ncbi:restriction endonuclease subunit S [Aeromonas veronii]
MEQVLYSLPAGWEWSSFDYIFSTKGFSVGKVKSSEVSHEGLVPVVDQSQIFIAGYSDCVEQTFSGKLPVLIYGDHTNCVKFVDFEFICGADGTKVLAIEDNIHPKYAFYLLSKFRPETQGYRRHFSLLKKMFLPVPPPDEQKRIVEKLDALLTRIDTAIEHLHSKLDLSKQLFDSILDEFFKLPECDAVPLTEVVDFIGGSQPPKSQFSDIQKEGYVRLIQIRDYKSDNYIVYVDSASTKKFCTKDDVMIGRYGPPVFQILRGLDGAYNVALMKAVPNEDVLTKDYLFWFLQSPSIQNYVIGISQRAAGQSGVNKKALEKYLIPVPSKTMQNNIVDKVGQLVSKSRDLEAEVTAEIASLNQLKASILDSAFKGEL